MLTNRAVFTHDARIIFKILKPISYWQCLGVMGEIVNCFKEARPCPGKPVVNISDCNDADKIVNMNDDVNCLVCFVVCKKTLRPGQIKLLNREQVEYECDVKKWTHPQNMRNLISAKIVLYEHFSFLSVGSFTK